MSSRVDLFWQAYLINFLFWSSMAQGVVIFAAAMDIMSARSTHNYVHIARRFAFFLPICIVLFAAFIYGSGDRIFSWISNPIPKITGYLNFSFFATRGIIGLTVLAVLSWVFLDKTKTTGARTRPTASPWAVVLVVAFMIVYYYLSTDLVLSPTRYFYSTLFQACYSFSALYLGAASLCVASYWYPEVTKEDRRKLSLLLFGFAPFWLYLLWCLYIVMWYSDMLPLTQFIFPRLYQAPWNVVTIIIVGMAFALPFVLLLPKRTKATRVFPFLASLVAIVGLLFEKFMFVVPSFSPGKWGIGWIHLWVTVAYAALFGISYQIAAHFLRADQQTHS